MTWWVLLVLVPLFPVSSSEHNGIRVMTFNIWQSGANVENGQQKIAKHILMINPDIVALQEVYANVTRNLTMMLGHPWVAVERNHSDYPDTAILTRHVVIPATNLSTSGGVGVKIMLRTGYTVGFWSLHLDYSSYGPYAANNKLVDRIEQIMAGENLGRGPQINEILNEMLLKKWLAAVDDVPIFVAGDFNGPSHLDWTERTKKIHGDWVVRWPATKELEEQGFVDTYREIYPNVVSDPGITWSTVNKLNPEWNYTIPEPQDRIDFLFYKGPVVPYQILTYSGCEKPQRIPFHHANDYPSDHFAVFADYTFI
uniref:Endo/exonuclease/phosphatase domain-containing protein n=1 Tax=Caenorhabditis japonica TaxID=281687 RepID=A0A8R1DNZ0_CAEJA